MSSEAFHRQELVHIARMIVELERIHQRVQDRLNDTTRHHPVMRPEYWQKRIDTLMNSPDATDNVIREAAALLGRLAASGSTARTAG